MTGYVTQDKGVQQMETEKQSLEFGKMQVEGDTDDKILVCSWEGGH